MPFGIRNACVKIFDNQSYDRVWMFYIQALLYDIDFTENDGDTAFRMEMETYAAEHGAEALHEKLRKIDPASADSIHANNVKRVIRALEFYHQTGKKISEHNAEERQKESPYDFIYFVLNDERSNLYDRINLRVDLMVKEGLVDEVKSLRAKGYTKDMVSMQGLGYKEILDYLDGEISFEEAIYRIKRDTRHFAKRQITWFKRERDVTWINKQDFGYDEDRILSEMISQMKDKLKIERGN